MARARWILFALMLAGVSAPSMMACAPRIVTDITGQGDQVKLVYNRSTFMNSATGIVKCTRDRKGNLEDCRDMTINWHKE